MACRHVFRGVALTVNWCKTRPPWTASFPRQWVLNKIREEKAEHKQEFVYSPFVLDQGDHVNLCLEFSKTVACDLEL